jgi:hypothetical protein
MLLIIIVDENSKWIEANPVCSATQRSTYRDTIAQTRKTKEASLETRLSRFLLEYRVTPCELLQRRRLRTQLDRLKPNGQRTVDSRQQAQKDQHDMSARSRQFKVSGSVRVRDVVAAE